MIAYRIDRPIERVCPGSPRACAACAAGAEMDSLTGTPPFGLPSELSTDLRSTEEGRSAGAGRAGRVVGSAVGSADRLREPVGHAGRAKRPAVDGRVARPPVREQLAIALDGVVVAEAGAADLAAPSMDEDPVGEARRPEVAHVRLEDERLDSPLPELRIAARVPLEVLDAGDLEPDEVDGVVHD